MYTSKHYIYGTMIVKYTKEFVNITKEEVEARLAAQL
jgi:hypothetical protein